MAGMTVNEERVFHRPKFDANGVVVARKEITLGGKVYAPSTPLPKDHGLDAYTIRKWWDLMFIDTLPRASTKKKGE